MLYVVAIEVGLLRVVVARTIAKELAESLATKSILPLVACEPVAVLVGEVEYLVSIFQYLILLGMTRHRAKKHDYGDCYVSVHISQNLGLVGWLL